MNCKKIEKMLSSYLDNSLNITDKDEIKKHLNQCQKCMDYLNTITKIDNLIKLKVKEKPSKEYWESYLPQLENKLNTVITKQLIEDRKLSNSFILKFAFAFNGVLIALLIFLGGLLYINTQQIKSLQLTQEEMQQEMSKTVFHLITKTNAEGNMPKFDKLEKL